VPHGPNDSHCIFEGIAAHELIHSLGFWHEQARPDRDDFVKIDFDNVIPGMEHNFNKITVDSTTIGLPYDYNSLMHYESTAFSKNGKATIVPIKDGVKLPSAVFKTISPIDIEELRSYYDCI
jgi:hypothetical protein